MRSEGRPSTSRTRGGVRCAVAAGSLFASLGIAELASGLVEVEPPIRFREATARLARRVTRGHDVRVLEHDTDLFWRLVPGLRVPEDHYPFRGLIANEQGLREDHPIPADRRPDEVRILFLGDSCTFGFGLTERETFVHVVEERLSELCPELRVECINAGVPGYSLFQGWRFLAARGLALRPDLVVVGFGTNDGASWDGLGDREHHDLMEASQPPPALRWSRLAHLVARAVSKRGKRSVHAADRPRLLAGEFDALLEEIHDATRRAGAELLLLVWPMRTNVTTGIPAAARTAQQRQLYAYARRALSFGPRRTRGVIDLVPVAQELARELAPDEIFQDGVHATAVANRRFAQAIVRRLRPWLRERSATGD